MNYTINKSGNYGIINPIPIGVLAATLDKYLQYERQGKQYMSNPLWATVKLYRIKTGTFPYGLIKLVQQVLDKYCETTKDSYKIINNSTLESVKYESSINLRDYQNTAVKQLIENNGGIICMPTGSGKTITIIEYLKMMNKKAIVIVPTKDIRTQWNKYELPLLTSSTYQNPLLKNKEYIQGFDVVIIDECHHTSAKSIYNLAMKTKTNTILIGASASPKREDGEDMKITAALGGIIYEVTRKELISKGYISDADVYYLKPELVKGTQYMDYQQVYSAQILNNEPRNTLITKTAIREALNQRRILILVSLVEHGEKLFCSITDANNNLNVVFMNGKTKDRDRDMNQYNIIIATSIYDEGYNLPSLDCLILAGGGKSETKVIQRIGRVLRMKPDGRRSIIYDFEDNTKYLKKHVDKRKELLSQEFTVETIGPLEEYL